MSNYAKLGNYLLIEKQEETGIAEWWRGATLSGQKLESHFLVDVINGGLVADRGFVDHYLNQSTITTKLEHPNILRKVTSTFENQTLASVFEFNEGFSLEKVLERCREDGFPLAIDHALLVGSKLLSALAYAKGKHITHGFLNPSVVFVTHEGEIKLKGFSISSALRHFNGALPFGDRYKTYVPQSMEMLSDDRDHLDIYGVGSILFEMLTGETVLEASGSSAAEKIANALTAADGEAIPDKIATILNKSLDANQPDSYHDIQVMAKDMEDLLFSGEYSPTTFNLAFFMHSAFRAEMESMNEKLAAEAEQNFGAIAKAAPVAAPEAPAPPPTRSEVTMPDSSNAGPAPAAARAPEKKGGLPLVPIAIGAVVVIIAVVAFMFMGGSGDSSDTQVDQMAKQLAEEGRQQEADELKRQQEELRRQNQMLMQQLEDERRQKAEEDKALLEADMNRMDEEIARLQREQQRKEELAQLEAERKRLAAEKEKVEQMQKEAEERRKKREEAQRLAQERAEQEQVAQGEDAVPKPTTEKPKSPTTKPATDKVADNKKAEPADSGQGIADSSAASEENDVIISEEAMAAYGAEQGPKDIPNEGDLIEFDDPYLMPPVLLETYTPQEAPRKAIRAGVVDRGKTLSFLMRVLINTEGEVDDVELFRSPLADNSNDFGMIEKAKKVARKLKFSVPKKHDVKVKTWWFIPVNFTAR